MKINFRWRTSTVVIGCMLMLCYCGQKRAAVVERTERDNLISSTVEITVDTVLRYSNGESVVVYKPPLGAQEKIFDAILDKYRDKVVVVDFWATWCGPCMQAMKAIKPLKEEMKGEDVVWLYLTGETSPMKNWTKTYPDISGEHFRVSKQQFDYWSKTHNIKAIPTYLIYDRQGKQLSKYKSFPGVEVMRRDIVKGL